MNAFLSCMEKMTGSGSKLEEGCLEKAGEVPKRRGAQERQLGWFLTHPDLTLLPVQETWS